MRSFRPAVPRAAALSAIAFGTGLFGFAVGGVGAVDQNVAAAERQQRFEQVRQLTEDAGRDCPFEHARAAKPVANPEL